MSEAASKPRVILVMNPTAGKGRGGVELVRLRHRLQQGDVDGEIYLTQAEGDAATFVAGLKPPPGSIVVAVGGDGTVHEVGNAVLEHEGVILGVIPIGSGNDYASLLGMPDDPLVALEAIINGHNEKWDVGVVGPHHFFNTVGFGFSASVSYHSRNTGPLRGLARYGLAILRAFRKFHPMSISLDGLKESGTKRITLMEVGIGNRCGGGFRLTENADPADGLLDVCVVKGMSRLRLPLVLPRGLFGKHIGHPLVGYEQVPGFRLRVESQVMVHVDGEIRLLSRGEHSVKVRPLAITVRRPGVVEPPVADRVSEEVVA